MAMGARKDNKVTVTIAGYPALGEQSVASHDKRSQVGSTSALARNTTSSWASETKQMRQGLCRGLFNHSQGGGDLEYMQLGGIGQPSLIDRQIMSLTLVFRTERTMSETTPTYSLVSMHAVVTM